MILTDLADQFHQQSLALHKVTVALNAVVDKLYTLCDFAIKDTASKAQEIVMARVRLDSILSQEEAYLKYPPESTELQNFTKKLASVRDDYEQKKEMFFSKQKMLDINRV